MHAHLWEMWGSALGQLTQSMAVVWCRCNTFFNPCSVRIEDCHKKGHISWNPDAEAKKKIHGVRKIMRCSWPVHLALSPCLNGNGEGHWGVASRLSFIDFGHKTSMYFLRRTSRPVAPWSCWRGLLPFCFLDDDDDDDVDDDDDALFKQSMHV